ncbi:hypothetical protein L6164_037129 [Bauhinia variegata]|uniref:Uncharacterized protein n=1 Tax=Bauhinia variegata TaxID=167791 RepID=A0ACB9KJ83_BAUVA|nr:hypothetical protein L6164_037129 [Bauhinia variegata]
MRTSFLALCLLLFAYRAAASVIIDTDGEPVSNHGGPYYLVPVSKPNGGVGLGPVGNDNFPAVVLDTNVTNVFPVRFATILVTPFILSSDFVGISFVLPSIELGPWTVLPEFPIGWAVKVVRVQIWGGPFKVRPAKNGYKIVYYPERGATGADVGIVYSGGYHRLVVKDGDPFIFKIKKATESSARIMSVV